ncbi:CFEM domain-containing protein [Colletotrichum truncatum]|uniref:CFEM domain-containing protein n=1 Tax=Colletotrichum truncatum TaxID=5467 RepID=A0ACC3YE55_COLTU
MPLIILLLALFATTVVAQQPAIHNVSGISLDSSPSCSLPCFTIGLNQTDCAANDQKCLCGNQGYIKFVEGCLLMSCPLKHALDTQNITWAACDFPYTENDPTRKVTRIVLFVILPSLSIILRFITKFAGISTWGLDDYSILLAYFLLTAYVSLHFFLEDNGAGQDLWSLTDHQINNFFKGFYALQTLYHSCIDVIKASILFMYLRIFHLPDEKVRVVLWATQVVNLLCGLIYIFIGLFQCQPIHLAWTFWTGETMGKCMDITKLGLSHAGINIGLDVWMLILAGTQVWGMNLALRKKLAIMAMFSLGLFLTIVSIIRITAIFEFKKSPMNPTVAMMPSVVWTDIELYVGIFTACIPNLRQFFNAFILRKTEKRKRLNSAVSGDKDLPFTPRRATITQQLSEIDNMEDDREQPPKALFGAHHV